MFTQQSKIHANDPAADDWFGICGSLFGDTALIGLLQTTIIANRVLVLCTCLLVRALMVGRLHNSLNSTRAMLQLLIISVFPCLYTATRL